MSATIGVLRVARVGVDAVGQVAAIAAASGDPDLVTALHRAGEARPYATRTDGGAWREIVAFDPVLLRGLIAGAHALGLAPAVTATTTLQALLDGAPIARPVIVHRSPCYYRTAGGVGRARLPVVLPDVERMLDGLRRAWEAAGGPALPPVNARAIGADLLAYERRCWPIASGHRVPGFVGELQLDCSRLTDAAAATVARLLRFGAYRGVGAHTTYGMGWIEVR